MSCCMICSTCSCGCHILPQNCIAAINFRAKKFKVWEKPELEENVNTVVLIGTDGQGILGQNCFNALCAAIKEADTLAEDYRNSLNGNYAENDPKAEFWYYLPEKWNKLLSNSHFKNMYVAYLVYYYYKLGYADAETTLSGDINHKIQATATDGFAGENISLNDAKAKAGEAGAMAKAHYTAFINNFWNANKSDYDCLPVKPICKPVCNTTCKGGDCDSVNSIKPQKTNKYIRTRGI